MGNYNKTIQEEEMLEEGNGCCLFLPFYILQDIIEGILQLFGKE